MGKALIIAEKPSLARNICAALSTPPKWVSFDARSKTGYYDNGKTIVTSAFGHLLELNDAEDYDEKLKLWHVSALPIIPDEFRYKVKDDSGTKAQLRLLKKLIADENIDRIVNAGDSDREGEIIIRNILRYAGNTKPVYRLWMPDQTPQTIRAELMSMKEDSAYDNLANEGYARTYIDWLYGINLTRLCTRKGGKLLRVGRVTSPIVSAICERERAIRNFVPEKYYVAEHNKNGLKLTSKKKNATSEKCGDLCALYNGLETVVTDRTTKDVALPRPKLFALSDLQGAAGKAYKMTPKGTLDVLQKLYEAGYVSYPRTNSRFMATAEKQKARDIVNAIKNRMPGEFSGISFRDSKYIFDDSQIEAHSAITPTYKIPDIRSLPVDQQKIYCLILRRFAAAFCTEDYKVSRTAMTVSNGKEDFQLKGDILITKGYTVFEKSDKKDETLPDLKIGDKIEPHFAPAEKSTEPPRHYTADTLNAYLKNPFSKEERKEIADEDESAVEVLSDIELGTEATRAGLIDAAIKSGYITLTKNVYGITDLGEFYCDLLAKLGIDMTKSRTLDLGKSLKMIYRDQKTVTATVDDAKSDLCAIVNAAKEIEGMKAPGIVYKAAVSDTPISDTPLCACPKCGKNVFESSDAWVCENRECGCTIAKSDRFFSYFKVGMTEEMAKILFTEHQIDIKGMVSAKTGKKFDATVKAEFTDKLPKYSLVFDESKTKTNGGGKTVKKSAPAADKKPKGPVL